MNMCYFLQKKKLTLTFLTLLQNPVLFQLRLGLLDDSLGILKYSVCSLKNICTEDLLEHFGATV